MYKGLLNQHSKRAERNPLNPNGGCLSWAGTRSLNNVAQIDDTGGVVGGGCRDVAGLIRPDTATAPAPRCNLQGLAVLALNMCYIGALSFTRCCTCRSDLIEVDPQ
ncbi:hypothetical protein J6590_085024 [Homalodisca vitripennis]|nr:hypothetical protein J6590_085024 [Homalodisca vitripennis]